MLDSTAKYWLTNKLSNTNKIEDGFLDIGFAGKYYHAIHKLPRREELQDKIGRTFFEVYFKMDTNLESILSQISILVQNKSILEQLQIIADVVTNTMGGIKPLETLEKDVSALISGMKAEQKSSILRIGSMNCGSFYHRALFFKTLCDRLGIGSCGLVRRNNKMAWNTIGKSILYSDPSAILNSQSHILERMSDTNDGEHAGLVDDSSDDLIVDLIFKPGVLLHGKEAQEYINYYG